MFPLYLTERKTVLIFKPLLHFFPLHLSIKNVLCTTADFHCPTPCFLSSGDRTNLSYNFLYKTHDDLNGPILPTVT